MTAIMTAITNTMIRAVAGTMLLAAAAHSIAWAAGHDDAVERCDLLRYQNFASIRDAPTEILESHAVASADGIPAYCRVVGYVSPNTGIELRLPLSDWNRKFFYAGCTGHCGIAAGSGWAKECDYPLTKGYACIVSDLGHRGSPADGLWAHENLDAKVDFAYRATHRSALAGKRLTEHFYNDAPELSYYMGCSTGGRQGLVAAQRFPWDFDAIIVGAPVVSQAGTSMDFMWNLRTMANEAGTAVFSGSDLERLHRAAIAAGDAIDGLEDGIIGDPRRIEFDPASLVCRTGRTSECLDQDQVEAARKMYLGPVNSLGERLYPGAGLMPGSETGWAGFSPRAQGGPAGKSGIDSMRYMVTDWGPEWRVGDFDFDRDYKRLGEGESLYSAGNPDLRAFERAGGKLMLYQGWSDPIIAPMNSVDYYETVERTMGGRGRTQEFFRLFMIPGMQHCFGGGGAFAIDYISAMEDWVERRIAPDRLTGAHLEGRHDASSMIRRFPMDAASTLFTRPVFPYPGLARYKGSGDPDDAASFEAVMPAAADESTAVTGAR